MSTSKALNYVCSQGDKTYIISINYEKGLGKSLNIIMNALCLWNYFSPWPFSICKLGSHKRWHWRFPLLLILEMVKHQILRKVFKVGSKYLQMFLEACEGCDNNVWIKNKNATLSKTNKLENVEINIETRHNSFSPIIRSGTWTADHIH